MDIAEESLKTKKAREKLRKQLEVYDQVVTPEALETQMLEIQKWLARHSSSRIPLKNEGLSLFNENIL